MRTRTLCQVIESWARHQNGECFCDECVAREIGEENLKAVSRAMIELSTRRSCDFSRYHATCTSCRSPAMVIATNRLSWA